MRETVADLMRWRDNFQNQALSHQRIMADYLREAEHRKARALECQEKVRQLDQRIEALSRAD